MSGAPSLPSDLAKSTPHYLTTKEVADLLRVKERKVYDLAAAGEIPHLRVTGKLLFPHDDIVAWIGGGQSPSAPRPAVIAGSHDPLLDWTLRESGSGLAALFDGSADGLARFAAGNAALCALHVPEEGGWNVATVAARGLRDCVLLAFAARSQGLILADGVQGVGAIEDLAGRRVALRQPGAGARELFDRLAAKSGLTLADISVPEGFARTETEAAAAVHAGEADVALGLEAVARQFRLRFVALADERFDVLVDRRAYFTEPVQRLFAFARTEAFARKAQAFGGYDIGALGSVRWLSP